MTDVVVEYLGALQAERGAARNTLDAYRSDLTDFTRFLSDHRRTLGRVGPTTSSSISSDSAPAASGPRASRDVSPRCAVLYKHLVREGALRRDPTEYLEAPRRPRALPRTLSREAALRSSRRRT
jgi:integrase/recombinase XerD